ncbi:MAG: hypothetical protein J6Z22_04585 [Lachnospiraceae bacterium]|nr:hypothetical protein [Lachnospiraceae bacterium]
MDFINALASYGLVLLCFVIVGGVGIALGIAMRKRKNLKDSLEAIEDFEETKE